MKKNSKLSDPTTHSLFPRFFAIGSSLRNNKNDCRVKNSNPAKTIFIFKTFISRVGNKIIYCFNFGRYFLESLLHNTPK